MAITIGGEVDVEVFGVDIEVDASITIGGGAPAIVAPYVNAKLWGTLYLGFWTLPPPGHGVATVKATSGQKLDEKAGSGTDKASTTQQGTNLTKVDVSLRFTRPVWVRYLKDALTEIDPNNPIYRGGPFPIGHPDVNRRNCYVVLVEEVGPVEWEPGGGVGTVSIKLTEWVEPAPTEDASSTPEGLASSTPGEDGSSTDSSGGSTDTGGGGGTGETTPEDTGGGGNPGNQDDSGLPPDRAPPNSKWSPN